MLSTAVLLVAVPLSAHDPGVFADPPASTAATSTRVPARPDNSKVGGDTVDSAFVVTSLPFVDSGSTTGYADDYDAACCRPARPTTPLSTVTAPSPAITR